MQLFLPEYKHYLAVVHDQHGLQIWPRQPLELSHRKLLSTSELGDDGWLDGQNFVSQVQAVCDAARVPVDLGNFDVGQVHGPLSIKIFAVHWSVHEFVEQAKCVLHPLSVEGALPDILRDVVNDNSTTTTY